jgi:hypothetical protein
MEKPAIAEMIDTVIHPAGTLADFLTGARPRGAFVSFPTNTF